MILSLECIYRWLMCCILALQIMVQTAQRRQALGEVEARHREILRLEADIRVSEQYTYCIPPPPPPYTHTH